MTWRLTRLDEDPEVFEALETGIATKPLAKTSLKQAVRAFLNGEYNGTRWEVRYMPNRNMVRFVNKSTHRTVLWKIEQE